MKKGVDYPGVTVTFCCHDGKGNYVLSKRGKIVGMSKVVGTSVEEDSTYTTQLRIPYEKKLKKNTVQKFSNTNFLGTAMFIEKARKERKPTGLHSTSKFW